MTNPRLFHLKYSVYEMPHQLFAEDHQLKQILETNMATFFNASPVVITTNPKASQFANIFGIDQDNCPIIFAYTLSSFVSITESWVDTHSWLTDHQGDFTYAVQQQIDPKRSENINWKAIKIICIAQKFSESDKKTIEQINTSTTLYTYQKFGDEFILFDKYYESKQSIKKIPKPADDKKDKLNKGYLASKKSTLDSTWQIYHQIYDYLKSLDESIILVENKYYVSFKAHSNIADVEVHTNKILVYLKLKPSTVTLENGFTQDVSGIGHLGTGDLKIIIKTPEDFTKAKQLIYRAYIEEQQKYLKRKKN